MRQTGTIEIDIPDDVPLNFAQVHEALRRLGIKSKTKSIMNHLTLPGDEDE